jgi:hypothetical protein
MPKQWSAVVAVGQQRLAPIFVAGFRLTLTTRRWMWVGDMAV